MEAVLVSGVYWHLWTVTVRAFLAAVVVQAIDAFVVVIGVLAPVAHP